MNITKDTSIASLLESDSISVRAANVCHSNGISRIEDLLKYSQSDLANLRNCGRKTSVELVRLQAVVQDAGIWPQFDFNTDSPAVDLEALGRRTVDGFDSLNRATRRRLEIAYGAAFSAMSVRTRNIFSSLAAFSAIRPYIEGRRLLRLSAFSGCGKRSSEEIAGLLRRMTRMLTDTLAVPENYVEDEVSSLEYHMTRIGEEYPFLDETDRRRVAALAADNAEVSPFFLISRYICSLGSNHAEAYRLHYCIGEAGTGTPDMASIASRLGLTRERVRQLLLKRIPLPAAIESVLDGVRRALRDDFMRDDSPVFDRFLAGHMAPSSRTAVMGMVTAIDDSFTIVSLSGSDRSYLVRKRLMTGVKIMATFYALNRAVFRVSDSATEFDVVDFIRRESGAAQLAEDVYRIAPLFTDEIGRTFGVTVEGSKIRVRANRFSITAAIEKVLADAGHAMTLTELYGAVADTCPQIKLPGIGAFKLYIYNSPNVAPVGKSGRYVLTAWDDVFTGTICQCVEMILRNSSTPLSVNAMMPKIRKYFPDTTAASVSGIISMSVPGHFIPYGRSTYGVAGKKYPGYMPTRRRMPAKVSFAERFARLREFMAVNNRFPGPCVMARDDGEGSLYRWLYNSTHRNVAISEADYAALQEFLGTVDHLPRNRREETFYRRCSEIRADFDDHGRIESTVHGRWLAEMTDRRETLEPRLRRYLDELLAYLKK